jgi:hypothetical protein
MDLPPPPPDGMHDPGVNVPGGVPPPGAGGEVGAAANAVTHVVARPTPLIPGGYAENVFNKTPQAEEATAAIPALEALRNELLLPAMDMGARMGMAFVGASEPMGALVVLNDNEPSIQWCHGAGIYNPPLGTTAGTYDRKMFLFIGDQVDGIFPVIRVETTQLAGVALHLCPNAGLVPTQARCDAHYAHDIITAPTLLVSHPIPPGQNDYDAAFTQENFQELIVPAIMPVPIQWAAHFSTPVSPREGLEKVNELVQALPQVHRHLGIPIQTWARKACLAQGHRAPARLKSAVGITLDVPQFTTALRTWATKRLTSLWDLATPASNNNNNNIRQSASLQTLHPAGIDMEVLSTILSAAVQAGSSLQSAPAAKPQFSQLEVARLTAVAGVPESNVTSLPKFWEDVLEHGKKPAAARMILEAAVVEVGKLIEDSSTMWISDTLAKDLIKMDFGFQGNISYFESHRGLSIMAVPPTSAADMLEMRGAEEDMAEANTITPGDTKARRRGPPMMDFSYSGTRKLLDNYRRLLMVVVGANSSHLQRVTEIRELIVHQEQAWATAPPNTLATILWLIFLDSRGLFSARHDDVSGDPPVSTLGYLVTQMRGSQFPSTANVPAEFLASGKPRIPSNMRGQPSTLGGGHTSTASIAPLVNSKHNSIAATATKAVKVTCPTITVFQLIAASDGAVKFKDCQVGLGHCMDFQILGRCAAGTRPCNFQHVQIDNKIEVERVVSLLGPAMAKIVAAGPKTKTKRNSANTQ